MHSLTRKKLGFASYDFSNSGYVAVFQSFLFPLVLTKLMDSNGIDSSFYWAAVVAISSILAILTAPFLGRFADKVGKAKVFIVTVVIVGILTTFSFPVFGFNAFALLGVFLLFNWIFELSQSIYDSFLVNLSENSKETTQISSFAWGFGYLGGAIFALLYFFMEKISIAAEEMLIVFGILFVITSIPAFFYFLGIEKNTPKFSGKILLRDIVRVKKPVPWKDLFVYWVIADTVAAILYFAPIYLKTELHLSTAVIGGVLLLGQLVAFPATIFVGRLSTKIGRVKTIKIGLLFWIVGLVGLYLSNSIYHVVIVFLILSLVVGSTQALLRAHFSDRVELSMSAEGLGFFAIAQKSASIFAPIIVLGAITVTGGMGPAFIILAVLVIVAFLLSSKLVHSDS